MKLILLVTILLLSSIYADDLQRVESIVNDITKLKKEYSKLGENYAMCQYDLKDEKEKEKNYKNSIASLKNQMKKLKKELLRKEKSNNNPFPNLKMKPEYLLTQTKASSYRVNKDANIYDGIDGKIIDKWDKETSFTSNQRTQNWIKITGFFVKKVWRSASKEMWVRVGDAHKRSKKN